jgi:S-adenosylmethionine synthetase
MGLRENDHITLTIACALIGRFLGDIGSYCEAKSRIHAVALETARSLTSREVLVQVNAADDMSSGAVYLTVTGTSAEAGDDGETGRGNRANGLITPYRPMALEAMAGKNPITHTGKLYSAAAICVANALVAQVSGLTEAECHLLSQIGSPIDRPRVVHLRIRHEEKTVPHDIEERIRAIAWREIARIPTLWEGFLAEAISVA